MNHYLAYHHPDYDPEPARVEIPGHFSSAKLIAMKPGDRIWLLTRIGAARKRNYVIDQVYEFHLLRNIGGARPYCYEGHLNRSPHYVGKRITDTPLFRCLMDETARFHNCGQPLSEAAVNMLESLKSPVSTLNSP